MAARAASFAVLVVAGDDRVPSGRETLTEYEGNKLIVAVDREEPDGLGLEVAYRLAAARVAMARDRDLTVDAPAVRDAAEEAVSCLKQAQQIRASLTGIKTSSDKARATLDEMVEAVRAKLERIDGLVEESSAPDRADPS
jgi:NAD(P)-dependent dehydrogenase (short-subunit alcohol dehydrogenase family)